jgi:hypothetical protein
MKLIILFKIKHRVSYERYSVLLSDQINQKITIKPQVGRRKFNLSQ